MCCTRAAVSGHPTCTPHERSSRKVVAAHRHRVRGLRCPASRDDSGAVAAAATASKVALVALAATALQVARAPSAQAHEQAAWRPRRHHFGIKELRQLPEQARPGSRAGNTVLDDARKSLHSTMSAASTAVQRRQRAMSEGFSMSLSDSGPASRSVSRNALQQAYNPPQRGSVAAAQNGERAVWLIFAAVAVGVVLLAFWGKLRDWVLGGGRSRQGRWVRDRSLGGKMVFIEDDARPAMADLSPLRLDDTPSEKSKSGAGSFEKLRPRSPEAQAAYERPAWWVPRYTLSAPKSVRDGKQAEAKRLLKRLQNDKLLGGRDYDVYALQKLYELCRDGGTDVGGSVSTDAGRSAMLRAATQETLRAAAKDSGSQDRSRRDFVCGLSAALGMPEAEAVDVVHTTVTTELRSHLLAIAAGRRSGDLAAEEAASAQLLRVSDLFPIPQSALESMAPRFALLLQFTQLETTEMLQKLATKAPHQIYLFVVLLGFDAATTIPALKAHVQQSTPN